MFYLYILKWKYLLSFICYLIYYIFFNNTRYKKLSEQTIKENIEKSEKKRISIDGEHYMIY